MPQRCLGRLPSKPSQTKRLLKLARYLLPAQLPAPPTTCDWYAKAKPPWGTFYNDSIGDCTCAAIGHALQVWTSMAGVEFEPSDDQILQAYMAVSGYDPNTGMNDNGAVEIDALNYFRRVGVAGHNIEAYVAVNPKDRNEVLTAISLFGGVYLGVDLPRASKGQKVWSVPQHIRLWRQREWTPGSWGGHAIFAGKYDQQMLTAVSWGEEQPMTWDWFDGYTVEAYALLSPDWFDQVGHAPNGFDIASLRADLAALGPPQG